MRIFGWTADSAGCGHYRMHQPLTALGKHSHSVNIQTQAQGGFLRLWEWRERNPATDICVGQRIVLDDRVGVWQALARFGARVFEIDDDMFHIDPSNPGAYSLYAKQEVRDILIRSTQEADLVTVTTAPLAETMIRKCQLDPARVTVVPNCMDAWLYDMDRPRRDRITIGWTGGISHDADMAVAAAPLSQFLRRNPEVDFHTIGHDFRDLIRVPNYRLSLWRQSVRQYHETIDFDIGIAPLKPSTFNRSKSGIKAMEYMALGIPAVVTDAEPYREVVIDGETGFLIRREHEWGRRLRELVNDHEMREAMGKRAREHSRQYSIEHGWMAWETAYRKMLGGGSNGTHTATRL